ncbi:hypothetical protein MMC25_008189 [Agyrium rufum]|nr:hypothetical protein [Agyrium rufum]
MNLATGTKEAKLNNPNDDDEEPNQGLVVALTEGEEDRFDVEAEKEDSFQAPEGLTQAVLQSQSEGPIRPPTTHIDGEGATFSATLHDLETSSDPEILLPALDVLEELAHDIYYGLSLSKDRGSMHRLFDFLSINYTNPRVKASAALVFGTAIQNNPAAFSAALSHFYNDELPSGPMEAVIMALIHEQVPQVLGRFIYLLSALCQDDLQLTKFVDLKGLKILLDVFEDSLGSTADGNDRLRIKIANFILDHFANEEAAVLSSQPAKSAEQTAGQKHATDLDDEWVIIAQEAHIPTTSKAESSFNLGSWCTAFSQALKVLGSGNNISPSSEEEREHISQVREKLQRQLGTTRR